MPYYDINENLNLFVFNFIEKQTNSSNMTDILTHKSMLSYGHFAHETNPDCQCQKLKNDFFHSSGFL